jgi:23S rRNA-/tRNA-specific pseudouridylate synthase
MCWHPKKNPVTKSVEANRYAKFVIETGKKHQIRLHCQHA